MKYNSSSRRISIINYGKDGYISNGLDYAKIKKNYSKNDISHHESSWNSKSITKSDKKILITYINEAGLDLQEIGADNSFLVQSLMDTSYTRQIVSDFAELDECYYRGGLL